jgi:hypothetical protein
MSTEAYDPNAPEGDSQGKSAYLSKKDLKTIGIVGVVLGLGLYPIYQYGVRQSEKSRCKADMKSVSEALNLYAEAKDDRFPPLYRTGDNNLPGLGANDLAYTWCDDVAPLMSKRYSFVCPSAKPEDLTTMESPTSSRETLKTSYGLYAPYGAYPRSLIATPDQAGLLGETSNRGANGSYDPMLMKDDKGRPLPDGFVIAWDNSNFEPNAQTRYVTHLAFPETSNGKFRKDGPSRHDGGIHVMTVTGEILTVPQTAARFEQRGNTSTGLWAMPTIRPH